MRNLKHGFWPVDACLYTFICCEFRQQERSASGVLEPDLGSTRNAPDPESTASHTVPVSFQ